MNIRKMMLSDKRELVGKINQRYADTGIQLAPAGNAVYCSIILKVDTVKKLKDLAVFQNNAKTFDQIISDLIKGKER